MRVLESGELLGDIVRRSRAPGIRCLEVVYDAGVQLARHAHEAPFFALSMDGAYRESSSGRTFECRPRSVVFHAAGEEHAISIDKAAIRCFVVELDSVEIEQRYGSALPHSLICADGGDLATLLTAMYREFRYSDSCSSLAIQGLVLQLLAAGARKDRDEGGRPSWVDRITELLHERFRSAMTLEEIAAEVGVSPAQASAAYRQTYHRGIAEQQRRLRIDFASRRLLDRDATIAQIAVEAGFADQSHFARTFREITGMTPKRYRSMLAMSS